MDGVKFIFGHGAQWVESVPGLFPGWLFRHQVACLWSVGPPTTARHGRTWVLELDPKVLQPAYLPSNSGRHYTSKADKQAHVVGGCAPLGNALRAEPKPRPQRTLCADPYRGAAIFN